MAAGRRAATVTRAPRPARNIAKYWPSPLEAPVTSACLPSTANASLIQPDLHLGLATSAHFFPHKDGSAHRTVEIALVGRGGDRQRVPVQHEMPDLIGPGPSLVPGDVDVVDHDLIAEREGARIGNHCSEKLDALF